MSRGFPRPSHRRGAPAALTGATFLALAGAGTLAVAGPAAAQLPGLPTIPSVAPNPENANPGTITGKVTGAKPPSSKGVVVVRAINAATGAIADVATVGSRGTYTLAVAPGAYGVRASIVRPGRSSTEVTIPVTVASGKKRAGVTFAVRGSGKLASAARATAAAAAATSATTAASEPAASRSYVTADGTEVAGVTAYAVEEPTGGKGDWAQIRRGLPAALQTEIHDGAACGTQGIVNKRERSYVERSLKFKTGRVVARGTKVQRNLIVADVGVTGTLEGSGSTATANFALVDRRTGKTFDSVSGKLRRAQFSKDVRTFAKAIAQRLCRTPEAYELTLAVEGKSDYRTHTATGRLDSVITAQQVGGQGGQRPTWRGSADLVWTSLAFGSKLGCTFGSIVPARGNWTATLAVLDGDLTVDWGPNAEFYITSSSATATCPGVAQPVSGLGGPSLAGVLPNAQRLPLSGGTLPVSGELKVGDEGVTSKGTIIVKPLFTKAAPGA